MPVWVVFERIAEWDLAFVPEYRRIASASVAKYGGRYRSLSFTNEVVEGPGDSPGMISVIEFDSREIAKAWLASPEYAPALALRNTGVRNRVIIMDAAPPDYARTAGAI
jgi:uncharacterized protein (DUF1330 family)